MSRLPGGLGLLAAVAVTAGALAVLTSPALSRPRPAERLAALARDDGQVRFGVHPQWSQDDPDRYTARTAMRPYVYGEFVRFPYSSAVAAQLDRKAEQVAAADSTLLLTLEPHDGLSAVTDDILRDLTVTLRRWNEAGTAVLVRFAHEMNGSWYSWGQQPLQYVDTFRRVAQAVRAAPGSQILWSPNEGGGYPFEGGWFEAQPGTAAHAMLDTDADGSVTQSDDPYRPYYPGDEHVDWVGQSLYHFGDSYPWGENAVPEPGKFAAKLTGTYDGLAGDESALPDFHHEYALRPGKPLAISETSALYNPGQAGVGASNQQIKTAWLAQVFADDLPARFPGLRLIMWFEQDKLEPDVPGGATSWSLSRDPSLIQMFRRAVPSWLDERS